MSISRRLVILVVMMVVLTTAPYVVAILAAPPGTTFRGAILDISDYNSYLAKMQQGARGDWLYYLPFTAKPHEPALLQTFYVALGHVARWTGLSFDLIYQLARIICVALMVLAMWAFMSHYLPENAAWWALLLALFAGGMSYLLLIFAPAATQNVSPIEFWLLDAYIFLSAFAVPHFAFSIALFLIALLALDRWTNSDAPHQFSVLFLTSLVLIFMQPFDVFLLAPIIVIVIVWRVRQHKIAWTNALAGLVLIGISQFALVAYNWIVLFQFAVWQSFAVQNALLSPPPIYYILGFAPTLFPAIGGIVIAIHRREGRWLIPILWLIGVALLLYAPQNAQRRFLLGIEIPLAMLTVYWLSEAAIPWMQKYIRQRYRLVLLVYAAFATLSTVAVFAWILVSTGNPANRDIFVSADTSAAWNWINANSAVQSVILSGEADGNNIAARTGRRVVLGHDAETAHLDITRADVQKFFSSDTANDWRVAYLRDLRISFVWYASEEQGIGQWSPQAAPYLHLVYQNHDVKIYQVVYNDTLDNVG